MGRGIWGSAALALIASGCGGGTNAGGERCSAGDRAAWMTHQLRRDQFTIRSLENELALLRAQLRDTPGASSPAPEPPPAQPAQPTADVVAGADQAGSQLPPQVADSIYGDVEVVYEGEAATESTVRPRIELHEATRVARGDDLEASPPPAAIPDVGAERLPVMRGKIPTVDEQLRRARPASGDAALPSRPASSPGPAPAASAPAASAPAAPVMNVTVAAAPAHDVIAEVTEEDEIGEGDGLADGARGQVAAVALDSIPTQAPAPAPAPDPAPSVEPALPAHPIVDYKRAIAALKRGRHTSAVAGLRAFLERFPDHYLADNVQYFLAESYYRRKLYREARGEYRKV
ncbi:MAG TPA: hypothetical protein VKB80_25995, partial [Kofleriaceae bacterium]|nr:hypothetical protein [Kofleriaceae bacterium]